MSAKTAAAGTRGGLVRAHAARINARVVSGGESLDRALATAPMDDLRDVALLRAISYGTLRCHERVQWQAEQLLSRPLSRRDVELAGLLRVGLFQLQWLRVPQHAAVAATVAAAAMLGVGRAKGLVNAVLRRFLRERAALEQRMQTNREALLSHPSWLIDLLETDWPAQAEAMIAANNAAPPRWLRHLRALHCRPGSLRSRPRQNPLRGFRSGGLDSRLGVRPLAETARQRRACVFHKFYAIYSAATFAVKTNELTV